MRDSAAEIAALGAETIAVGFSPAEPLADLRQHLGWEWRFLSDTERTLYTRLGLGRGRRRDVYNRGTLRLYARALRHGTTPRAPVEDTLQLGGDAILAGGRAVRVFRPSTPDDRPSVSVLLAALRAAAEERH